MWEEVMVEDELDGNGCMSALCAQLSERFGLLEGQPGGAMPRRRIMGLLEALACMCLRASRVRQREKEQLCLSLCWCMAVLTTRKIASASQCMTSRQRGSSPDALVSEPMRLRCIKKECTCITCAQMIRMIIYKEDVQIYHDSCACQCVSGHARVRSMKHVRSMQHVQKQGHPRQL